MRLLMQNGVSRVLSSVLVPVFLMVACTQVGKTQRGVQQPLLLETRAGAAVSQRGVPQRVVPDGPRDAMTVSDPVVVSTPRAPAQSAEPARGDEELLFAVVSDLNGSYGQADYADGVHESVRWLVEDVRPDLVVSTGDMVAGQRAGLDYAGMWTGFHAAVTAPFRQAGIPFAVTPGNHDASAGAGYYGERIEFATQWSARRPKVEFVDDRFYPMHYAFKAKGVLFVSLDATMVGPIDAAQRRWLRGVLEANADARAKVVYGHIPLYPVAQGRETEILRDEPLEQMLNEFDVDLMLSGHHHAYYPGRRGDLRLVNMACLGSGPRKLVGSEVLSPRSVALVRVSAQGEVSVDAFEAGVGGERAHPRVERETLPEYLNDGAWRIWRDDVDPTSETSKR